MEADLKLSNFSGRRIKYFGSHGTYHSGNFGSPARIQAV